MMLTCTSHFESMLVGCQTRVFHLAHDRSPSREPPRSVSGGTEAHSLSDDQKIEGQMPNAKAKPREACRTPSRGHFKSMLRSALSAVGV